MRAEPARRKGNQREPEKQVHVCPQQRAIDAANKVEKVMVIVPVYRHIDEAQHVAEEGRRRPLESAEADIIRRFQLEDHDGDDHGDHAIAECSEPILFHCPSAPLSDASRPRTHIVLGPPPIASAASAAGAAHWSRRCRQAGAASSHYHNLGWMGWSPECRAAACSEAGSLSRLSEKGVA